MQLVEKTSFEIEKIFKIIAVVYDSKILSFDRMDTVIRNFNTAFQLSTNINFDLLYAEIWDDNDTNDDIEDKIYTLETEFEQLLNWKSDVVDIVKIKELQHRDLIPYFERLGHLNISCSSLHKTSITDLFVNLGLRLLKARIDLNKIIEDVKKRKELQEQLNKLNASCAADYSFKLTPDKLKEFTILLFRLYKNNFFTPVSNKYLISEIDVIGAFETFFDVEILNAEWFSPELYFENDSLLIPEIKSTAVPAKSPELIKKELSVYFRNLPFDSFLEYLRDEFKTEKGKNIAILLHVLKNNDPVLLEIPYGKLKKFYNLLKSFFNTEIGSYQSIANYSISKSIHQPEINSIKARLDKIMIL